MKYPGSCLCGKIRFEIEGEFQFFFLCHCEHCQKDTGSAHAANPFSADATINWSSGKSEVTSFKLPATRHQKSFCSHCGSALPTIQGDSSLVVPAGSLDVDIPLKPKAHIFVGSKASWESGLEQIECFEKFPK